MRPNSQTTTTESAGPVEPGTGRPLAALLLVGMAVAIGLALLAGPAFGDGGTENQRTGDRTGVMLSPPLSPPVGDGPFEDSTLEWFNDSDVERVVRVWCRPTDSFVWTSTGPQAIPAHSSLFVDLADGYTWYCLTWGPQEIGEQVLLWSNVPVTCSGPFCNTVIRIGKPAEIAYDWIADPYFVAPLSPPVSPPLSPPTVGMASIDWENASDFDVSANLSCGNTYQDTELVLAGGHLRIDSIPENARNCYIWVVYPRGYNVWAKANGPLWCNKQSCTILVLPNTAMKVSFRPFADPFNPPPPLSPPVEKPKPKPTPTAEPEPTATVEPAQTPTTEPDPPTAEPEEKPAAAAEPIATADPGPTPKPPAGECTIVGTSGDDVLRGTDGDDVICGRGGNDILIGGPGDDILRGGRGDDILRGGKGNDLLIGGPGDDRLVGKRGADRLFGKAGHDVLRGGGGADYLSGGRGRDKLRGGRGADTLMGRAGADRLWGGKGNDVLRGGKGSDTCEGVETVRSCESIRPASGNHTTGLGGAPVR